MKILIFGGSGFLGNALIKFFYNHQVYNFSRDEAKHVKIANKCVNIIGDIRDRKAVKNAIYKIKPQVIIVASAMKHIDICEKNIDECLKTNVDGLRNVLEFVDNDFLERFVFVSTDKACNPSTVYGMSKYIGEQMVLNRAKEVKAKLNVVRYGNIIGSTGSLIPKLNEIGKNTGIEYFELSDESMTRFFMKVEEACDIIEYAIMTEFGGVIIIPLMNSFKIKNIFEVFSNIYKKPIIVKGTRITGEKIHECLLSYEESMRTFEDKNYIILTRDKINSNGFEINSSDYLKIFSVYDI